MQSKVCQRCGKDLTKEQRWNHRRYCSRTCSHAAQFGEKIEWNGIWIRPGQTLEVLKLYQKGLSEAEAQAAVGADHKTMRRIRSTPEFVAFLPERLCLFCGDTLPQKPVRKYCSSKCTGKAKYDRENIAKGRQTRRVDQAKRSRAIDLFSRGLGAGSIARYLDMPRERIERWVYAHPIKRRSELCPALWPLLPLKHRLNKARSAEEWVGILHDASQSFGALGIVTLITERRRGGGAPARYVSIVRENLNQRVTEGAVFAFCNILRTAITIIEWSDGNFRLTRTQKSSGTFVWPGEHLGDFVTVTRDAFSHLLAYQKNTKSKRRVPEIP